MVTQYKTEMQTVPFVEKCQPRSFYLNPTELLTIFGFKSLEFQLI